MQLPKPHVLLGPVPQNLSYDYCLNAAPTPDPLPCMVPLAEYDQCGGKTNCTDYGCKDAAWPSACCPIGLVCNREDPFYWHCLDPILVAARTAANSSSSSSSSSAGSTDTTNGSDTSSTSGTSTSSSTSDSTTRDSSQIRVVRQPGSRVFLRANISTEYSKLASSPEEMARFKSSLVGWLKQEQWKPSDYYIDPKYVFDAGEPVANALCTLNFSLCRARSCLS